MFKKNNMKNVYSSMNDFLENEHKLSEINKIFKILLEDDKLFENKFREIENYNSENVPLRDNKNLNLFILSYDKKINFSDSDKINGLIVIFQNQKIKQNDEFSLIEYSQNLIKKWSNCSFILFYANEKISLIKKIVFNGIITFINVLS